MILTSKMDRWEDVERVIPEGWLMDYMQVARHIRFPLSFHVLNGLFVLSSVIGRRAAFQRIGYRLYPPMWVMLLGTSGVGKGMSMAFAKEVVARAVDGRPEFVAFSPDTFTRRGLVTACIERAREHELTRIEGAIFVDELSAILTNRTGNESIVQFFLKASEMKEVSDLTGHLGQQTITNFTCGFACTSTVELLRDSISASIFAGGFMHRFFIAHELFKPNTPERNPTEEEITSLGDHARELRDHAPDAMTATEGAERLLSTIARRAEAGKYANTHLAGYWNRFEGLCAKIALTLALSQEASQVTEDHVTRAETLVHGHLYKPLVELVEELEFPVAKRALFKVGDDLFFAGPEGISMERLRKKLPASSNAHAQEQIAFLRQHGLMTTGKGPDGREWVWRLESWKTENSA